MFSECLPQRAEGGRVAYLVFSPLLSSLQFNRSREEIMRNALWAGTAAMLAAMAVSSAMAAASQSDKAQIMALEKKYNDGFNAKNVDEIMSCYGDDLFVFDVVPPREYPSWEAYKKDWDGLFAAFPGLLTNTISEQTITVVGPVAYGHNIQSGTFTRKDGSKVTIVDRTTDIYRKIKGKWLIVEEHNSVPVDLDTMKPDLSSKM
jgi:ketosteroid isomerase-like protein